MTITIHRIGPTALQLDVSGKLEKKDYEQFTPRAEATIRDHGEVNFLIHITETPRFTPAAFWEDLKFGVAHYSDVGRMALVSPDESREWLATISKPFTKAEVRFFEAGRIDAARDWVSGQDS